MCAASQHKLRQLRPIKRKHKDEYRWIHCDEEAQGQVCRPQRLLRLTRTHQAGVEDVLLHGALRVERGVEMLHATPGSYHVDT